jgi:xanthine dehydrogenase FAD-binding subunit
LTEGEINMIPFNFQYCRPSTLAEARDAFRQLQNEGKRPMYYAGGSETITMCRAGSIQPGAVIDIKKIPECNGISEHEDGLDIGAACTLNQIKDAKLFPLLGLICGRIADHTNQCRITIGGNVCGTIIYRETSLPLILSDAQISIWGEEGLKTVPFQSMFCGRMELAPGELVTKLHVPRWALHAPYFHAKHTAQEKIDYPVVSMAALVHNGLRIAFSGLASRPFRSVRLETILNNTQESVTSRVEKAARLLQEHAYGDAEASGAYRIFVLKNTLTSLLEELNHG